MRATLRYTLRAAVVAAIAAAVFYWMRWAPLTVSGAAVKTGPVQAEILGSGTLMAHTKATIIPKIQGRLVELTVDQNDTVTTGQLLARLDDSDFWQQLAIAKATLEAECDLQVVAA
ncbi:MAG: biotin/lipoyl-binding protein [Candidatus Sumerlaeota bacterium]|nr:biotin/lipoyl-binding protein [Candidatus Sumerlaeota bacterium]